jgi:hypothetical protein
VHAVESQVTDERHSTVAGLHLQVGVSMAFAGSDVVETDP